MHFSASLMGLPSGPGGIASASSIIKILTLCRRKLRGDLLATIFSEPPGKRLDIMVSRALSFVSPDRKIASAGLAAKIGSTSETR